jgi:fatty-acyl-CoA synthase
MQQNTKNEKGISYSHGSGTLPLSGLTIGGALDRSAQLFPDNDALVVRQQGVRYRYRELLRVVNQAAKGFLSLGIQKGDRVAIWATNHAEWVVTQFATAKVGAILVNINPAYKIYELEYALRQSESQTLILIQGFREANHVSMLSEVCPEVSSAKPGELRSEKLPFLKNVIFIGNDKPAGMFGWEEILSMDNGQRLDHDLDARAASLDFDDPINIQYTSGTTGFPKGAVLSHHNVVNNALFVGESMKITHQDRVCIPVPFYHCFGMVLGNMVCVVHGSTMVIPAEHFNPLATLEAVHEERCTALHGVPTMFIAELEHPEFQRFDLSSLRTGIMAGSPCPIELMKKVVERMHCRDLTIAYGLTESSPVITQTRADDPIELRVTTVGRPLPHTETKIIDPSTEEITLRGVQGELCTRGYLVMKGYHKNSEATNRAIDRGGWLHTGDLATMDANNYLKITGRVKDMIVRGGENIYPREIEEFLYTHPKISQIQVIGIPDAKYGEEVMAWIKLKDGVEATAEEIRDFCQGKISHYKTPKHIKFVDSFPMTVTGKIQKFRMREIAIRELRLEEAAKIETA